MSKRSTKMEIQITQEEFDALLRGEISFDPAAIQHDKEEANRLQDTRDAKFAEQQIKDREWKERTDAWVNEHWNDASLRLPWVPIMHNGVLITSEEDAEKVQNGGVIIVHESAGSDGNTEVNQVDGDLVSWTISFFICLGLLLSIPVALVIFALTHSVP